jgi:type I restriction enzyme S subunit
MTSKWPLVELGCIAEFRNGLNYTQAARENGGLPIVGVKDFQSRSFVTFDGLEELDPNAVDCGDTTIMKGDILFVRSNGNRALIGRSLYVREPPPRRTTYSGFVIRARFTSDQSDPEFFAYVLRGPLIRSVLSSQGGGTNISNLNQGILSRLKVPCPRIEEQRRVASILAVYDDLIEVNRRRIALLEEMARRLYEEWFVRFRFPGHGSVTSNSSAPDGWATMAIRQLGKVVTGKTPSKANPNFFGGSIPFVKIPDMHGCNFILSTGDHLSSAGAASQSGKTIPPGSLCVSCIATIGLVSITTEPSQTNQQINSVILEREHFREFLFFSLKAAKTALQNLGSNGATMGNVNKDKFEALSLLVPVDSVLQRYHDLVDPMFSAMKNCLRANNALIASRDLLLPRLISGDLTVTSAERELEAVA